MARHREDLTGDTPYDMSGGDEVFTSSLGANNGTGKIERYTFAEVTVKVTGADAADGELLIKTSTDGADFNFGVTDANDSKVIVDAGNSLNTFRLPEFTGDAIRIEFTANSVTAGIIDSIKLLAKDQS